MPDDPLPLEEAQARLLKLAVPLPAVDVPVEKALGLVLSSALTARHDRPPADVSAMDGWAVRFGDLPGPLQGIGESAAGTPFDGGVGPGQAVRIFTGAHLPAGADCVAVQEEMAAEGANVRLIGSGPDGPGANIRRRGQDLRAQAHLLAAGCRLGAAEIGLLVAGGHAAVPVRRRARVVFLATGSELVPAGRSPGIGQIPSSNGPMLAALALGAGADVSDHGIIADELGAVSEALAAAAADADIVVTIGGASVGDHDLVRPALHRLDALLDFWRVAIRPGKPLLAGRLGDAVVLGLPGNPVSAFVCAELFLLPLVRAMMGDPAPLPGLIPAVTAEDLPANGPRRHFMRAVARWQDGRLVARPARRQDSSLLSVLAASNALLVRPEHAPAVRAGAEVSLLLQGNGLTCSAGFL